MAKVQRSVIGSVRLDSDVWDAVRSMGCSLNVYLRGALLDASGEHVRRARKISKKAAAVEALRQGDVVARAVGREDVEYGSHTELPAGPNVATLDVVGPTLASGRGKATTQTFQRRIREKGDKTR